MTKRIRRSRICAQVLSLVMIGLTTEAFAQGLGDVARKEAERREQIEAGKVYTNDDFPAEVRAPAPVPGVPSARYPGSVGPAAGAGGHTRRG